MQKNPGLAAVLSFLFCGLGQIYNGQFGKAVAFILGAAISGLLSTTPTCRSGGLPWRGQG